MCGIVLNDLDLSGCLIVIKRCDRDGRKVFVGGNRYLQIPSNKIRFLGGSLSYVICARVK